MKPAPLRLNQTVIIKKPEKSEKHQKKELICQPTKAEQKNKDPKVYFRIDKMAN